MRFHRFVALFAAAVAVCAISMLLAASNHGRAAADNKPAEQQPCVGPDGDGAPKRGARPKYAELQQGLNDGDDDEIAALEAIRVALTEVGDGSTYVWRHRDRIGGVVHPTSSFKDAGGRICRHIVLVLARGAQSGRIEGIACRLADGRWELDG